jgi:arylsulfatase A-like enzyme
MTRPASANGTSETIPSSARSLWWRIDRADRKQAAVRHGKWKYVADGQHKTVSLELLFDLENDPSERFNLGFQHPDVMAKMRQLLSDWEADVARHKPALVIK